MSATGERTQHAAACPATDHGHADVAAMLLKAGASVNATAADGDTPLLLAVDRQDPGLIRCLLQAGANGNAVLPANQAPDNTQGFNLLAAAASQESVDIVQDLQKAGACSSIVLAFGHDALEEAVYQLTQGNGSLGMLQAVLTDPLFPPSATATKHAVYNATGHRLGSMSAQLQLCMFRQCRLEGKDFSAELQIIYRSLPILQRQVSRQELVVSRPPLGLHDISMALLRGWQAVTAERDAAGPELAH